MLSPPIKTLPPLPSSDLVLYPSLYYKCISSLSSPEPWAGGAAFPTIPHPFVRLREQMGSWLVRLRLYFHKSNWLVPHWAPVGQLLIWIMWSSAVAPIWEVYLADKGGEQGQPFQPPNLTFKLSILFPDPLLASQSHSLARHLFDCPPSLPCALYYFCKAVPVLQL